MICKCGNDRFIAHQLRVLNQDEEENHCYED